MKTKLVSAVLFIAMGLLLGAPSHVWSQDDDDDDDYYDEPVVQIEDSKTGQDAPSIVKPELNAQENAAEEKPSAPISSDSSVKDSKSVPEKRSKGFSQRKFKKSKPTAKKLKGKVRLVEMLVKNSISVKKINSSDNEKAKSILAEALALYEKGKVSMDAGDLETADASFNDAMRKVGVASRMIGKGKDDLAKAREEFASLKKSVTNSIKAIERVMKEKGPDAAEGIDVAAIQSLLDEGLKLAEEKNLGKANIKLTKARNMGNKALKKLRHKDTIVDSLEFDSPEDEYIYVIQRNKNYKTLISMMAKEKKPSEFKLKKINAFVGQSDAMLPKAKEFADKGDFAAAVKVVDNATKHLSKALRSLGVMVFD